MIEVKELQQLKEKTESKRYVTIYLNTDQSNMDQKKGEWKIRLKNGLKKLEEYIEASNSDELQAFKKIKKFALKEITDMQTSLPKSILFIGTTDGEWYVKELQVKVENDFSWEIEPNLTQLHQLEELYPVSGVLLIQKLNMLSVETVLGEITNEVSFAWDLETEDWRKYEGVAATERHASGANHRDQFEQRFEANQQRWYKELASLVEKEAKLRGWTSIYLVGAPEILTEFSKHLTYKHVEKFKKNLTNFKSQEIVNEVLAS
ncbi:VLRF1 family aeRF1-type release factor [Bacillus solitudinis]|uniref:VLRF1 family aeRF1-type release factor n=1 Tax=Bacillus solitudinis TaxID=2014074 RepID=UPI000C249D43|nr:VLRF1 family aeRF1-type release factor [Bacillus solitudinis]